MSANENRPATKMRRSVKPFNAREIGRTLTEVAVDLIRSEDRNIESRWFHSPHDADLFFWRDDQKNIIKQQVTFFGQLIEWNVVEGLRTGVVVEEEGSDQKTKGSPVIRFDLDPQKHTLEQGLDIIAHTAALSEDDKRRILNNFVNGPRLLSLTPEEVLTRYGSYVAGKKTTERVAAQLASQLATGGFWRGLFKRILSAIGIPKKPM